VRLCPPANKLFWSTIHDLLKAVNKPIVVGIEPTKLFNAMSKWPTRASKVWVRKVSKSISRMSLAIYVPSLLKLVRKVGIGPEIEFCGSRSETV
jgi:hypothetical protein